MTFLEHLIAFIKVSFLSVLDIINTEQNNTIAKPNSFYSSI